MMNAGLKTEQVIDSATLYSGQGWWDFNTTTVKYFNRYDVGLVSCYYDLWWYMWPIPIIFIAVVWRTLVNMAFGLLSRIINIFGLILVNPLVCSIMPLDGGSGLTAWRKSFVSQLISAYFVVFVLNIFYIIYPLINSVSLFGGTTALESFPDLMFRFFFLLAGIQAISSMDKLFEKMFGRDDKSSFINDGKETLETVEKGTKEAWGVAKGAARVTAGAAMAAVGTVGTVAGAGIGGIRALHDRAQENQARTERDRHAAGANRTNAELRNDAMNNARGSTEYQNAYNTEVNNRMNQSYADYQAAGGGLTRDQWEGSATGSGSAFEAHNSWSNMTAAEKAAAGYGGSGGYARYMADQYNSGGQSGTTSYKDWLATGKTARNEFEVDANGNVVGKGGFAGHDANTARTNADTGARADLETRMDTAIRTGVATDDLGRRAIQEHQDQTDARETARQNYNTANAEYQHRRDVRENSHRVANGTRFGRAMMGAGVRTVFRGRPR